MMASRLLAAVAAALLATGCRTTDPPDSLLGSPGPGFTLVTDGAEPADLEEVATWLSPTGAGAANQVILTDAGFRRAYEKAWTQQKPADATPTINATVSDPIWLLVRIRMLEVRDGQAADTVLDAAHRNEERDDAESTFAVQGLAQAYGSSYSGRNGANLVQIAYTRDHNVVIVQTGSMQRWIGIEEAVGYAKQQHAAHDTEWPTTLLVAVIVAGLLIAGSVPGIAIALRRRRTMPGRDPPAAPAADGETPVATQ